MKLFEEKNESIFRLNSKRLDSISADFPSHVFLVLSRSESNLRFEDLKAAVWEKGIILEFSMAGLIIRTQKIILNQRHCKNLSFISSHFLYIRQRRIALAVIAECTACLFPKPIWIFFSKDLFISNWLSFVSLMFGRNFKKVKNERFRFFSFLSISFTKMHVIHEKGGPTL